jgi:methylmalonyl-CoA mutase C-terminal domain/subunit
MPDEDEETLKKMGVAAVLGQDTTPDTIVGAVRTAAADRTVGV